jgi:hypothetical protein
VTGWSGRAENGKAILAVLASLLVVGALTAFIVFRTTGDDTSVPRLLVRDSSSPNAVTETAPEALTRFARSLYEAQREFCQQPWSALLADAGMPPTTPFSRSTLRELAANLPYAPNTLVDPLLRNIATEGCVAGFLSLLKTQRAYALS